MSILIIDDEPEVRDSLAGLLRSVGLDSMQAGSSFEALNVIKSTDISLIVVDISMPGMSGDELIHNLRAEGKCPPAVIVSALSPWGFASLITSGIRYMRKPVKASMFLDVVASLLNSSSASLGMGEGRTTH